MDARTDLRAERLNRGLSQREMAHEVGVAEGVWKRAELGARPHPANARKIAEFFDRKVTDIWPVDDEDLVPV